MKRASFRIAGFNFVLNHTDRLDMERILPSFRPFRICNDDEGILFSVTIQDGTSHIQEYDGMTLLDSTDNDFGKIRLYRSGSIYRIDIGVGNHAHTHTMMSDAVFSQAEIYPDMVDTNWNAALSSMLHVLFSQAILPHGGISVHASAVILDGKGYLFLGKSGTGKSTHSKLWMECFAGCTLLNDDNPVIRIVDGGVKVYGTPWSGKTPCYRNETVPVAGIVRLCQSAVNNYTRIHDAEAFAAVLPSCSAILSDRMLTENLYDNVISICEKTQTGYLECRPDTEAAELCYSNLNINDIHE